MEKGPPDVSWVPGAPGVGRVGGGRGLPRRGVAVGGDCGQEAKGIPEKPGAGLGAVRLLKVDAGGTEGGPAPSRASSMRVRNGPQSRHAGTARVVAAAGEHGVCCAVQPLPGARGTAAA